MSAIKDGRLPILLDKERHLLFSLNALDAVQDRFGGYDKIGGVLEGGGAVKDLRWLLTLLLNEGKEENEPPLDEQAVGKLVHTGNLAEVRRCIVDSFAIGMRGTAEIPEAEIEDDGDNDDTKNAGSGQGL